MKKIISIAFAAVLAGFAISCQKEESVSEKTDAVQYTFNITVKDQVGFDSEASTKGGSSEKYKTGWENNDKIFLFFKPTEGSLLEDTYATLTYNGSSWDGAVTGTTSLGEEGTLSAVYVYNLGDVAPEFSDDQWTITTGNTFYNCQTEVSYTVSGSVISATLNLIAPTDFVRFSVYSASGALTCDKVKGWKDIAIGSDLAVSNVTCTGYMDGFTNSGDSNFKDYYGRIVSGNSLNGKTCKFSVVKNNGTVYERTATPSSDARSFKINSWTEAEGKLPGLFTISNGADNEAGTADDIQVRFSKGNLVAAIDENGAPTAWKFATNQYDYIGNATANTSIGSTAGDVDLFGWSTDATSNNWGIHTKEEATQDYTTGSFKDWGKAYCTSKSISPDNTWRTLSTAEWQYLFNYGDYTSDVRNGKYKTGVTVCSKANCVVLLPDNWDETVISLTDFAALNTCDENSTPKWSEMQAAGAVCLPAAGDRDGSHVIHVGVYGFYWSSTAYGESRAYNVRFDSYDVYPDDLDYRDGGFSVRLITESK